MPKVSRKSFLALCCILILLAAGCGSSSRDGTAAGSIQEYFGIDEIDREAHHQRVQESIASCMLEAGFDYSPEPFGREFEASQSAAALSGGIPDRQTATTDGYGISLRLMDGPLAAPAEASANEEYVDSLGEAARNGYQVALWGAVLTVGAPVPGGGCFDKGLDASASDSLRAYTEALPALQAYKAERFDSSPVIREIADEWLSCMGENGYAFESSAAAQAEIQQQLLGVVQVAEYLPAVEQVDFATKSFRDIVTTSTASDLDGVLEDEIAIAVADFDCSQPLTDRFENEVARIDADFLSDYEQRVG